MQQLKRMTTFARVQRMTMKSEHTENNTVGTHRQHDTTNTQCATR